MKSAEKISLSIFIVLVILLSGRFNADAQNYATKLHVIGTAQYLKQVADSPQLKLVELKKYIPGIKLDIRYATANNFTHTPVYPQARAFARQPVAEALKQVEAELKPMGLGLKVYDGYRPYSITVKFYQIAHDTNFVADPAKGSRHNRGCAVDLTIINLKTGKELDMPTGYDSFTPQAAADYLPLPPTKLKNRQLLRRVMEKHGFKVYPSEWWHFDYTGWPQFALMDVPFSKL